MTEPAQTEKQVFYPALRYRDAPAALEWLQEAFGLEPIDVHEAEDGSLAHVEMGLGAGVTMFGPDRESDSFGSRAGKGWVYVVVDEPDRLFARATAAGAEVVMELTDTDYGSRDFSVRDPEGNIWSFGTYSPHRKEG